jgi:predicted negative regulator of RcsB-dependent stress response
MKTAERHHLKTNEFAERVASATQYWATHKSTITTVAAIALAALVAVGAYTAYRQQRAARAGAALAEAMSIAASPVVPAAVTGSSTPAPTAGTYPSAEARDKAALEKFQAVATQYGSTQSGLAARYQAAALLGQLGRRADAEREYQAVATTGSGSIYGRMAQLGLAELQVQAGQYDPAIAAFREILARGETDLPADGILMQLGRACRLAGKKAEALQAFTRIVDEHPQSLYVAEARREIDALR